MLGDDERKSFAVCRGKDSYCFVAGVSVLSYGLHGKRAAIVFDGWIFFWGGEVVRLRWKLVFTVMM